MKSSAKTAREYLDQLPPDRRAAIEAVRNVMLKNLPKGYEETMQYGMISYVVPLTRYPDGYLGRKNEPLPYASLASQKNHMAIYFMNIYGDKKAQAWFKNAYKASGNSTWASPASDSRNSTTSRSMSSATPSP
jgi:uncharacterized protein DUF1801